MPKLHHIIDVPDVPGYEWTTVRWLRNQIYGGGLASHKVGGIVLIDLDDLDDLVASGRRDPVAS